MALRPQNCRRLAVAAFIRTAAVYVGLNGASFPPASDRHLFSKKTAFSPPIRVFPLHEMSLYLGPYYAYRRLLGA